MIPFSGYPYEDAKAFSMQDVGWDHKLSDHFKLFEFACHDGSDEVLVHPALIQLVEKIRTTLGVAISINSGYRSPHYNDKVMRPPGAKYSRHKTGQAADLSSRHATPREIYLVSEQLNPGGLGGYNTFVHVDVQGNDRRWGKRYRGEVNTSNAGRRISNPGLALIEGFEGYEADWYNDVVGVRTIGYGWTGKLPDGYIAPLSKAQARSLLRETVGSYEECVRKSVEVGINQNQFDAMVSFTYNLGCANLKSSTLLKKVNKGDFAGATKEFPRWNKAGVRVLAGLTRRRKAEADLFSK